MKTRLGLCLLAAAGFSAPLFAQSTSAVATVNCAAPGADLQRIIDNVPAGSTIVVTGACANGPYYLRKNLRIIGDADAVLSGRGDRVIDIVGANVRLERLTVDAAHNNFGVLIEEGSSGIVDQITVRNSDGAGLQVMLASYAGVTGSTFTNNLYGVFVSGSSNAWMDGNILDGNRYASVAVYANSSAFMANSQLRHGNIGVLVERLAYADVAGNTIENNTGPGVLLSSRISSAGLGGNTLQNNGPDIRCDARALLIVNDSQTSTTRTSAIDASCSIEGAPLFLP